MSLPRALLATDTLQAVMTDFSPVKQYPTAHDLLAL